MGIFDEFKKIGKVPVIAQIGGYRPDNHVKSWFGGNFDLHNDSDWPEDDDGYLLPIIQIAVSEVPGGNLFFGDAKLIQVFINANKLPISPVKNGDGWLLKEYYSLENLKTVVTPAKCKGYKPFQIKWSISEKLDYPCWEESWDYFDMTEINQSDVLSDKFFNEFGSYQRTKLGGYASYIQSPCQGDFKFVFQITSEEKPNFMVGDNGNLYIFKSLTDDEWYLYWDCY